MLTILRISLGVVAVAVAVASVRRGPLSGRTYTEPSSRHRQREPASGSISTPRSEFLGAAFDQQGPSQNAAETLEDR